MVITLDSWKRRNFQDLHENHAFTTTNHTGYGTLPDTEIIQRWHILGFYIQQWASRNTSDEAPVSEIIRNATQTLGSSSNPVVLVQAVIWHILAKCVFPTKQHPVGILWAGNSTGELKDLSRKAKRLSETEDGWKPPTSQLLLPLAPSDQELDSAVGQLHREFSSILNPETHTEKDKDGLDGIFREAINLQADLSVQIAWWYCYYPGIGPGSPPYGIVFDEKAMSNHQSSASLTSRVALMVSPALIKCGDSRGKDFNPHSVVCRSEVVRGHSAPHHTQGYNDQRLEPRGISRVSTWATSTYHKGLNAGEKSMTMPTIPERGQEIGANPTAKSINPIRRLAPKISSLAKRMSCCR